MRLGPEAMAMTMTSRLETVWEGSVDRQRRFPAPEELHRRVRAAIREAAEAGSWGELRRAEWEAEGDAMLLAAEASPR